MKQATPSKPPRLPAWVDKADAAKVASETRWAKRMHNERALAIGSMHIFIGQDDRTGVWYFIWRGPKKLRAGTHMLIESLRTLPGAEHYISTCKHHVVRWPAPADRIATIPLWPRADFE